MNREHYGDVSNRDRDRYSERYDRHDRYDRYGDKQKYSRDDRNRSHNDSMRKRKEDRNDNASKMVIANFMVEKAQ